MTQLDFDPVAMLGCTPDEAARLLQGRRVTPGEVEALAVYYYDWRAHSRDPRSYWVTVTQAARMLHQSPGIVRRLVDEGGLPHLQHASGVVLMRRHEVRELAQPASRR
jgi:hypothetical protein